METNELNNQLIKYNPMPKKIIIFSSVLVLIIFIVITLFLCGVFKSKGEKFLESLIKNQYFTEMIEDRTKELVKNGETNYNIRLKKKFLSLLDSSFTLIGNDLILDSNIIKQGKNFDSSTSLKLGTLELQNVEIIKEKDTYALSVPNLFSNFIVFNDENSEEIADKLGVMPFEKGEEINFDFDKFIKKYGKVLAKSINSHIKVEEVVPVNINQKDINTKQYTLSLSEKDLNVIATKLINNLIDDDDTINFIVNYVQSNEKLTAEEKSAYTYENLKSELININNELLENEINLSDEKAFEIIINNYNGKVIKTSINILENEESEIILSAISDDETDYMLLAFNMYGSILNAEYKGKLNDDGYIGEVIINTDEVSISAIDINVTKIENSEEVIRSIESLNALYLNEATDEEIEALRREIQINLGIIEDDNLDDLVFGEGEFKLENPEARLKLVDESREVYNKINFGMSKEDVVKLMGEPDEIFEIIGLENYGWYYKGNKEIFFLSVEFNDDKVSGVYNNIVSSMKNNIQISTELGTEILNLTDVVRDIQIGMSKEEAIKILGDKYLEIAKTSIGYSMVKWYDQNENRVIIEFDKDDNISYIDEVTLDR